MKKRIRIVLLLCLLLVAAFGVYQYSENLKREEEFRQLQAEEAAAKKRMEIQRKREIERSQISDFSIDAGVPKGYAKPDSEWLRKEKAFYEKLLTTGKYDVLIFPLQVYRKAFGSSTRSLMTAQLANHIRRAEGERVADPYVVARAVGDGFRQHSLGEYLRIADAIGVNKVVWGYVGHDGKGVLSARISVHSRSFQEGAAPRWTERSQFRLEGVAFDENLSPIAAYGQKLNEVLRAIGYEKNVSEVALHNGRLSMTALPDSPRKLIGGDSDPVRDAYTFLLLSALTPADVARTKERLAEKAYLATQLLSPDSPEFKPLRARTYMALGYRLEAMAVLGNAQTTEEHGLLAALDGNLPKLRAMVKKEANPLRRILLKLDEILIAFNYELVNSQSIIKELQDLRLPGDVWLYLLARVATEGDNWTQNENLHAKMLLDFEWPVVGKSLQDLSKNSEVMNDPQKMRSAVELSVFHHVRDFLESNAPLWCCARPVESPGAADYLDLMDAIGHDNLLRRIRFLGDTQGNPDQAVKHADMLEGVYRGYPYYLLERSKAEFKLSRNVSGVEKDNLLRLAFRGAFDAMFLEQGQSPVSNRAQAHVNVINRHDFGRSGNFYYSDVPFRPEFWTWAEGGNPEIIRSNINAAFKNSIWNFNLVPQLIGHFRLMKDEDSVNALLASLGSRFQGSPHKNEFMAREAIRRGDESAAEKFYRLNISEAPSYWDSYKDLGKLLFESGRVAESSKIFSAYPGFRQGSGENRVRVSNLAFEVGSHYYWSGHFDLALPFYKISASQQTGSGGEMSSALRLRLLVGDVAGAMAGSLQRARRYNDSYAYRDYLGILHASRMNREAWEIFGQLIQELPKAHPWETALVGHRMAGTSEEEVAAWVQLDANAKTAEKTNTAARYFLRFVTTDRVPSATAAAFIDKIDYPIWQLQGKNPWVVLPNEDGSTGLILGPDVKGGQAFLPLGIFASSEKNRVRSHYSYFVDAYRLIRLGEYAGARAVFDEAAKLYDLTAQAQYMMPYYALAAAQSKETAGIQAVLARVAHENKRFDFYLASAVMSAHRGAVKEAVQFLSWAKYRRPHTESRPLLTQYTFGDICAQLATLTAIPQIRSIAVDWARHSQRFEPWQSWGYGIEATLTTNAADRGRAIAMLHALDRNSPALAKFSPSEIDRAVAAYSKFNPFAQTTPKQPVAEKASGEAAPQMAGRLAGPYAMLSMR